MSEMGNGRRGVSGLLIKTDRSRAWRRRTRRRRESQKKGTGGYRRRRGGPVMLKPISEREKWGKKKGKRGRGGWGVRWGGWRKRKESTLQATQASLPRQSEEREIEREKQAGQGPAVGPDPYGAAGSGMNSEWSGWALGCWNLPPSLCEQDDQRQEGALQMARAINR